jgi:hypothetical protein
MAIAIERISGVQNKLGEGPVWDVAEQAFYWIDGAAPAIYHLDHARLAFGATALGRNAWRACILQNTCSFLRARFPNHIRSIVI